MNRNWKSIKVNVFGIPVPLSLVLLVMLTAAGFSLAKTWQNQGEWRTFDSRLEYETVEHPNFKLDYPATWKSKVFHGYDRGTEDVWADFSYAYLLTYAGLRIYWRPITSPTLNEISLWGQEIINRHEGVDVSELQEVGVGAEDYPAFMQTFQSDRTYILVYILDDESEYIFLFDAKPVNDN